MTCEHFENCSFIERTKMTMPRIMNVVAKRYCEHDREKCARYGLARELGLAAVPNTLWPDNDAKAREIVAATTKGAQKCQVVDLSDKCLLEFI